MVTQSQAQSDKTLKKNGNQKKSESVQNDGLLSVNQAPTAVLFDWDNTLVDTWKTIFYAVNDTLLAFGLEPWAEKVALENIQRSGREAFPKLFGERAKEAQSFFYKLVEENNLQGLNPMPEAENLLEILNQKGIPTGVVSNKSSSFLKMEVAHLGWDNYLTVLVGAGDAMRDKPSADPLLLALEKLNVPAGQHVWMIGDAPVDWDCAVAAGCQPIAIGNRFDSIPSSIVSIENCEVLRNFFLKM